MTPVGSPNTPAGFSSSSREFQEDPEIISKKKLQKKSKQQTFCANLSYTKRGLQQVRQSEQEE